MKGYVSPKFEMMTSEPKDVITGSGEDISVELEDIANVPGAWF